MFKLAITQFKTALILLISITVLTGLIYPTLVTICAQLFFANAANGSLLTQNDKVIGSLLIGQPFSDAKYFLSRPSATTPFPYNAENSSGANLGPENPAFLKIINDRVIALRQLDSENKHLIPVDLITASASGLDPDISPLAALYQAPRIARLRHVSEQEIKNLIYSLISKRTFKILGEPRINVLQLNIALDKHYPLKNLSV